MDKRLEKYFDENLRDMSKDPDGLRSYANELEQSIKSTTNPEQKVKLLGELGGHLRTLGELARAEQSLKKAIQLIQDHKLGLQREIQQKIRLGHVLQWKKAFHESDQLFAEILRTCRSQPGAANYLDFALQHAGKNFFDQNRFTEALECFEEAYRLRRSKQAPQDQIESSLLAIERTKALLHQQ